MPTIGTCAVCERAIRVRAGKMVQHGYRRPGYGHLVGNCFAVRREPYEVSCAATRDYRAILLHRLAFFEAHLDRLRGGLVHTLTHDVRVPVPTTRSRYERVDSGWGKARLTVTSTEGSAERQALWRRIVADRTQETESTIRADRGEVERCDRLIRDWRPGELREAPVRERKAPGARRRRFRWR